MVNQGVPPLQENYDKTAQHTHTHTHTHDVCVRNWATGTAARRRRGGTNIDLEQKQTTKKSTETASFLIFRQSFYEMHSTVKPEVNSIPLFHFAQCNAYLVITLVHLIFKGFLFQNLLLISYYIHDYRLLIYACPVERGDELYCSF